MLDMNMERRAIYCLEKGDQDVSSTDHEIKVTCILRQRDDDRGGKETQFI